MLAKARLHLIWSSIPCFSHILSNPAKELPKSCRYRSEKFNCSAPTSQSKTQTGGSWKKIISSCGCEILPAANVKRPRREKAAQRSRV